MADLIDRVASLTGHAGKSRAIPGRLALAAGHASEWLADHVTHRPPRLP